MSRPITALALILLAVSTPAFAEPAALRLPSDGAVVALGWGEVSAGYWAAPHLGFGVDASMPGNVGLAIGTRGRTGQQFGLDFGVAGGPTLSFTGPQVGLAVSPWVDFAVRGKGVFNIGVALPGTVTLYPLGAVWSAPLLLEAAAGWTFGTVRIGGWGNAGITVLNKTITLTPRGGVWLGVGKANRER